MYKCNIHSTHQERLWKVTRPRTWHWGTRLERLDGRWSWSCWKNSVWKRFMFNKRVHIPPVELCVENWEVISHFIIVRRRGWRMHLHRGRLFTEYIHFIPIVIETRAAVTRGARYLSVLEWDRGDAVLAFSLLLLRRWFAVVNESEDKTPVLQLSGRHLRVLNRGLNRWQP